MKSCQKLFDEYEQYVTPSELRQFLYCKRFVYFMKCLGIRQYAEKRTKVQLGNKKHEEKTNVNKEYIRKKINGNCKFSNQKLISNKYKIHGVVDELYLLKGGTYCPLDYKFSEYKNKDFLTHKIQMTLYSLMIEEMYNCKVENFYLVYVRSKNLVKEIKVSEELKNEAIGYLNEYRETLNGIFPEATKHKAKCEDCCYSKICIK